MSAPNGQNPFAWGNYQIGGGMANQSMTWLDGSPVNGSYINITALIPTQDSLQEFKVATSNLSPEYGRFRGRRRELYNEIGHQQSPRQRVGIFAQQRAERQHVLQ